MATNTFPQPFGKYILLNKIALGGMAEIFRAKTIGAEGFEKEVVIKRILPHYTEDEAFVTMFIDEAKVSSGLNHPNIVQIYDFDTQDECYYIAMEYIEGRDLRRTMDRGNKQETPLSVPQVVHTMMEVAKGLHYAHTKTSKGEALNIIHRDVSPQNVMLSFDGEVKIMDFGIAKAAARSTKTRAGTVKGKCAYMSPEQARGKDLDPRSDLFAVGVIMWEMLTGRRLFAGETDFETLTNVLKAEVPPAGSLNPNVPEAIEQTLMKSLSREREERQKDCKEFLRELENWYYPNVEDKEAAELGHYMRDLFQEEIQELQELQANDAETKFLEASEVVRAKRSGSSSGMQQAISNPNMAPIADTEAPTIALDAASVQKALDEAAGGAGDDATVALDVSVSDTLKMSKPPPLAKKGGGKAWKFIMLFFILAGLSVGGYFAWKQSQKKVKTRVADETTKPKTPTKTAKTGVIKFRVSPKDATIRVDDGDETGTGTLEITRNVGDQVTAIYEKDGYKTDKRAIKLKGTSRKVPTVTLKEDKPLEPQEVTVTIKVTPRDAQIKVGDQNGQGTMEVKAMVGDEVSAIFTHPDYEEKVKEYRIRRANQTFSVGLTKKAIPQGEKAVFEVVVTPAQATLLVDNQPQPASSPGNYTVRGYDIGAELKVVVKLDGHVSVKETIKLTSNRIRREFTLKTKPKEPTGPGYASFNARPWAKVSVRGKSCTTPCKLKLQSGRYRAKFKKGSKSKSRGFTVRAGKTKQVFVDMTR